MNRSQVIAELEKNKKDVQELLCQAEENLGHAILSKADKGLSKENIRCYESFNKEIEDFLQLQKDILALEEEQQKIKNDIDEQKELQALSQKQIAVFHRELGEALFENYTPTYADVFGQAYTNLCIEELKLSEAKNKVVGYQDDAGQKKFFSRILSHAKAGVTKTQIASLEQKRDSILVQGAKTAISSGLLDKLLKREQLDVEVKKALTSFNAINDELKAHTLELETLNHRNSEIKKALDNAGVTLSVSRRVSSIDNLIAEKKLDQRKFAVLTGHDYASRYVSPKGESITDFPKHVKEALFDIQEHERTIVGISLSIEIESTRQRLDKNKGETLSLNKSKDANSQKIEKLQTENQGLSDKISAKLDEKRVLDAKLASLIEEAASSEITQKVLDVTEE